MSSSKAFAVAVSLAFAPLARAELKLGYVDLQRALGEVEEGRAAKARLQGLIEAKEKEISKELEGRVMELAQKWEKARQDMSAKERSELQAIFAKMDPIIAAIAQREGMTMVFEKNDAGLVFAPPHLDMPNELVRRYNDQHKSPGAPKADAAKPADAPVKNDPPSDAPRKDQAPAPKK